ncbi:MAG: hypothetical protein RL265_978, partial [Bacteroidota bacterium]
LEVKNEELIAENTNIKKQFHSYEVKYEQILSEILWQPIECLYAHDSKSHGLCLEWVRSKKILRVE